MKRSGIDQFAPQVCEYDAVGNEVFALQHLLASAGIRSEIFCDLVDHRLSRRVHSWDDRTGLAGAALLVHYSHGSPSYPQVFSAGGRKILLYHSITPYEYFVGTHAALERASRLGSCDLPRYAGSVDVALAHSSYSAGELRSAGFPRVEVFPYVPYEPLYTAQPDESLMKRYAGDGWVNLITVGRIAPHKCLEDCIFVFDYFKRNIEPRSRLFIVGSWAGTEAYTARLGRLISRLDLRDVIFTGPVRQSELVAHYRLAQAFLSMSEHEGFGVPVVEAMRYEVPVFVYASTALPETLRGAGVLLAEKRWPVIAESIGLVLSTPSLRQELLAGQLEAAAYYSLPAARDRLFALLGRLELS